MSESETRYCSGCKNEKPLQQFQVTEQNRDGTNWVRTRKWCHACCAASAERQEKIRARHKETNRQLVAERTSDQQDRRSLEEARQAVITVGEGRGFILGIDGYPDRVVITAAHCLPCMPPAMPAAYLEEKTYKDLLGPLDAKRTIWAECVFVDPVADIAILCGPDNQALGKEAEKYDALVDSVSPLQAAYRPHHHRAAGYSV